jgi:hypothetical protein
MQQRGQKPLKKSLEHLKKIVSTTARTVNEMIPTLYDELLRLGNP